MPTTHVVMGASAAGSMRVWGWPDPIVAVRDDLSAGPLGDVLQETTWDCRADWWMTAAGCADLSDLLRSWQAFGSWVRTRAAGDDAVIWVADNPAEITLALCVAAHLPKTMPIRVVHSTKAYGQAYDTPEVQTVIARTGEIPADRFAPLMEYAVPLSDEGRRRAAGKWQGFLKSGSQLRAIINGQVESVGAEYWDQAIMDQARRRLSFAESVQAIQLVGDCIAWHPHLGDRFVWWRIRRLVESGALRGTGSLVDMRDCALSLPPR